MKERNPQAEQMGDESMLRNLAAQAEAIWPQEQHLFDRYQLPRAAHIADIGCGSGEITSRLAARYPEAELVGVDILEGSVAYARRRYASLAPRVRFEQGDAFELKLNDGEFDLVVCRHMTQAVPEPQTSARRTAAHLSAGRLGPRAQRGLRDDQAAAGKVDPDRLWHEGVIAFARATGSDARVGRRTWSMMKQLGFEELHVDYIVVDTIRVAARDVRRDHRGVARWIHEALARNTALGVD
jgi:SAM-dependent methyltransferase